jgi:hypothetical protein
MQWGITPSFNWGGKSHSEVAQSRCWAHLLDSAVRVALRQAAAMADDASGNIPNRPASVGTRKHHCSACRLCRSRADAAQRVEQLGQRVAEEARACETAGSQAGAAEAQLQVGACCASPAFCCAVLMAKDVGLEVAVVWGGA